MQVGKAAADICNVALEMLHVNRVEAYNSCVEAHVGFGNLIAVVVGVRVFGKVFFGFGEVLEERVDVLYVGLLRSGERRCVG